MQTRAHGLAIIAFGTSILVAACSAGATPPPSAPAAPATSSSSPSSVATDTAWVAPKAAARIDSYSLTLAATAPVDSVRSVTFATVADNRSITLCSAGTPIAGTTWSCTADLLELGIAPGKLSLMFSTVDRGGKVIDEPDGEISVTYAIAPPRPAKTTYKVIKVTNIAATDTDVVENLASWTEPEGYASTFRVYGVTGCIREAANTNDTPCVLGDTKIPKSALTLLGTLPGTARSMKVTERHQGIGGGGYSAIVVEASNDFGTSPFGVLTSAPVCWQCVY